MSEKKKCFRLVFSVVILVLASFYTVAQGEIKAQEITPLVIGEKVEIHSEILEEDRVLNIYLPPGYSKDSLQKYSVIYLLDGSIDEDFIHISGIVQFGSFSWINMIPETIVVGISNVDRRRDFTFPTTIEQDKIDFPTTGESKKFINFIKKELQPFVEENYHVNDVNTLIGQSLGALLATEILFTNPELFDNYIIVSPSLWWDNESLLKVKVKEFATEKSIFIAVGKEGDVMEKDARDLFEKLKLEKTKNTTLFFEYYEKQDHGDVLHLAVYTAFEKIFKSK